MSITERFSRHLQNLLKNRKPSEITISLSGGADSTALGYLLRDVLKETIPLKAIHLNHRLRDDHETSRDIEMVSYHCKMLKFPLNVVVCRRGEILGSSKAKGRTIEEVARIYRHTLYRNIVNTTDGFVALGHTRDDDMETRIYRFFRGAGIHGLQGISPLARGLLRPLLPFYKEEIYQYLNDLGILWAEDSTNRDQGFLRNHMRQNLIPVIREIFPGFEKALDTAVERHRMVDKYLESLRISRVQDAGSSGIGILREVFFSLSAWEKWEALKEVWTHEDSPGKGELPFRWVHPLLYMDNPQGSREFVCRNMRWLIRGEWIFLEDTVVPFVKKSYFTSISFPKTPLFDDIVLWIFRSEALTRLEASFGELRVRSFIPGDRISLRSSDGGRKKLKDLFREWRVPPENRWQIPLVVSSEGEVLGVLGSFWGYPDRISPLADKKDMDMEVRKEMLCEY